MRTSESDNLKERRFSRIEWENGFRNSPERDFIQSKITKMIDEELEVSGIGNSIDDDVKFILIRTVTILCCSLSLDVEKFGFKFSRNGGTSFASKVGKIDYISIDQHWLFNNDLLNALAEKKKQALLKVDDQESLKDLKKIKAQYLLTLIRLLVHEVYHVRQEQQDPEYSSRTKDANRERRKAILFSKILKNSDEDREGMRELGEEKYHRDLGERSARALPLRFLSELQKFSDELPYGDLTDDLLKNLDSFLSEKLEELVQFLNKYSDSEEDEEITITFE